MRRHPKTFPLEIVRDHLIARVGRRAAVVDTGSPWTMRAPRIVGEQLGQPVRWLVGTDVLARDRVLLDWPGRRLVVGGPALPGETIPLERHDTGIFQVELEWEQGSSMAWLDTGAPLSYCPASVVRGLRPVGHQTDYLVGIGEFEVAVYELTVRIGRRRIRGRFGVLPELFAATLSLMGATRWIIGADLFRDRAIQLDLANSRLVDTTVVTPRQRTTRRTSHGAGPSRVSPLATRNANTGIEGWRAWRLTDIGSEPRLQSMTADDIWDGPSFTADVAPTTERRRGAAGVHAYATPGQMQSALLHGVALVYGQVTLHGEVCVHEMGYRAEHARVDRLWLRACGRHAPPPFRSTGNLLLDVIDCSRKGPFCACDALADDDWLAHDELERIAAQLGDRYQCDVAVDVERPRISTHACRHTRNANDTFTRRR